MVFTAEAEAAHDLEMHRRAPKGGHAEVPVGADNLPGAVAQVADLVGRHVGGGGGGDGACPFPSLDNDDDDDGEEQGEKLRTSNELESG